MNIFSLYELWGIRVSISFYLHVFRVNFEWAKWLPEADRGIYFIFFLCELFNRWCINFQVAQDLVEIITYDTIGKSNNKDLLCKKGKISQRQQRPFRVIKCKWGVKCIIRNRQKTLPFVPCVLSRKREVRKEQLLSWHLKSNVSNIPWKLFSPRVLVKQSYKLQSKYANIFARKWYPNKTMLEFVWKLWILNVL